MLRRIFDWLFKTDRASDAVKPELTSSLSQDIEQILVDYTARGMATTSAGSDYIALRGMATEYRRAADAIYELIANAESVMPGGKPLACRSGCHHCCKLNSARQGIAENVVGITLLDGINILEHLEGLSQDARSAFMQNVNILWREPRAPKSG